MKQRELFSFSCAVYLKSERMKKKFFTFLCYFAESFLPLHHEKGFKIQVSGFMIQVSRIR